MMTVNNRHPNHSAISFYGEFVAHGASVTCLALGQKSGRVLVTGGEDKKVNLWAVGKPNCIMSLSGHTTTVECVKFGHTEDLVCAGSVSGSLKVWDLEAAKLLRTLTGHKSNVRCIDFHPYGDFVASGSLDTNIKLWDIRKKGCMYTYKGHSKDVYCLKFSPDGRWLASGGDEGVVKLWDLPAGKMLAELKEHRGSITDVVFHPNEFLLASSSSDGTVKFWDLETFQQVSTTVNDAGPVKKILFHPNGKAILSGGRDVLKVYGWEPCRTLDTIVISWGRLCDMAVSDVQLIGGTYSLTNVSVYVVDLKKVQPFGPVCYSKPAVYVRDSFSRQSTRRSFVAGQCSTSHSQLESLESNKSEETEHVISDDTSDETSAAEIMNIGDYREIFNPRSELCRTPPPIPFPTLGATEISRKLSDSNLFSKLNLSTTTSTFNNMLNPIRSFSGNRMAKSTTYLPETAEMSITSPPTPVAPMAPMRTILHKNEPLPIIPSTKQSTMSIRQPVVSEVVTVTNANQSFTAKISTSVLPSHNLSTRKAMSLVHPRQSEASVSIVRPVVNDSKNVANGVMHHPNNSQIHVSRATILMNECNQPPRNKSPNSPDSSFELIQETRDHPAGLDIDEFLPKHLQDTMRLGYQPQPEISESEAMQAIIRGHKSLVTALSHRRKNIHIVLAMWSSKDARIALEQAINMDDQSVIVDILNVVILKPAMWTLDMCDVLLPAIYELLQSKYECYMSVGCAALKLILKNFASIIKTNITAPPGIGVDISREERYNKCMSCYNQLLSVRAFILKRQTLQGKLGRSFRELSILMQNLE